MDTVLIAVTLISLAMALGMGAVLMKLLREERRRSDARVAALVELSADDPSAIGGQISIFEHRIEDRDLTPRRPKPRPVTAPAARIRLESAAPPAPPVAAYDMLRPSAPVETAELFAEPERSSPWGRRFAVIGAIAIVLGTVIFAAVIRRGADADSPAAGAVSRPASGRAPARVAPPLELAALSHRQDGNVLTISGVVRNPANGEPVSHIAATVSVFAGDGTSLATVSAPLDYTSLAAGDESPFVVTVTIRGEVARYRVGFRGKDGASVAHVDRRHAEGVARR